MRKTSFFSLLAAFALVLGGVGYADRAQAQSGTGEAGVSVYIIAGVVAAALLVGIIAASGGDDDDAPVSA
ncbi:hypothetical protein [Qipengyuania citrea]|uniref:hypothetical protein n=1 Tax=Qipengyuania citrea TaxID=225971 RepID=UPI0032975E9A